MMARLVGAGLSLFAFSVSVLAGLYAGNPITVILSRSILALFFFFVLGLLLGSAAQTIIEEHLKARKEEIRRLYPRVPNRTEGVPTTGGPAKD